MPFTTAGKNYMLNSLTTATHETQITNLFASLHHADPTTGDAHELTGGTYARQQVSLAAASNGSRTDSADPTFNVPSGSTVSHVGYYTLVTGGTLVAYADVTDENFGADGTYTLTAQTLSLT